jgi:hypothetical protein
MDAGCVCRTGAIDAPVPLWGATAMVLSELLVLYEEFLREAGQQ